MRIFVGSTEIAGIGEGLSHGFADLGHECDVVTALPHPFAYGVAQPKPWFAVIWLRLHDMVQRAGPKTSVRGFSWRVARASWSWVVLLASLYRYDAFIFLYGSTITNTEFELWLLRRLKKRIIFTYVGSDARPAYMDGALSISVNASTKQIYQIVKRQKKLIAMHERYANEIVSAHIISHFNSRPLVNWFAMGIPRVVGTVKAPANPGGRSSRVRVLHSPSNPIVKGTEIIEQAVDRLKSKGLDIELVMLKATPNNVVLAEIMKSDFVIDQVYSDQPLATFATEAAHFGKPAVVSGYFSEVIKDYLNPELIAPSEYVPPEALEAAIEKLSTDKAYRIELGARAKLYVEYRWSSRAVAQRYLMLIEGNVPADWYFDPFDTLYIGGCGLSKETTAIQIQTLVEAYGASALQVDDKPRLKEALLDMARTLGKAETRAPNSA